MNKKTASFKLIAMVVTILVLFGLLGLVIYLLVRQRRQESYALQPEPVKVGPFSFPSENVRQIMLPQDLISTQLMVPPMKSRQWQGVY